MLIPITLLLLITILLLIYLIGRSNESYWKKRGVTFYKEHKVTGVFWDFLTTDTPLFKSVGNLYKQYRQEPAVAFGSLVTPSILIIDPTNAQHVFQTDFQSFNHRGIDVNESDVLANNILFMNGNKWKLVRQSMSPIFTSAKIKKMFHIMDKSGKDFVEYLKNDPNRIKGDCYNQLSTYTCASIGASVFGLETDSVFKSPVLDLIRSVTNKPSLKIRMQQIIIMASPWLSKTLNIKLFLPLEDFFISATKKIIREHESGQNHYFADICVSLQKNGTMKDRDTGLELEPTDELLAAQAFFFFLAGIEPSAASMYACLLELGRNPEHLEKIHNEIDAAFEALDGKMTYECIMDMEYLEKVLCEGMRMYPPLGVLTRRCVQDTVLPVGNIRIQEGTKIYVSAYEMHYDPKYYPNPEVFDPERFASQGAQDSNVYMPFGKGNRLCVGTRFARLQVKTGLIYLLRHFTVRTTFDGDKPRYSRIRSQVRPVNVKVEFLPRKAKNV